MAVIHFWLLDCVRRRPQRVTSAGSDGRRGTLPPPASTAAVTAAATATAVGADAAAAV